eukprot:scaffold61936_cov32-Tisochrysis_lutea.AAC.1
MAIPATRLRAPAELAGLFMISARSSCDSRFDGSITPLFLRGLRSFNTGGCSRAGGPSEAMPSSARPGKVVGWRISLDANVAFEDVAAVDWCLWQAIESTTRLSAVARLPSNRILSPSSPDESACMDTVVGSLFEELDLGCVNLSANLKPSGALGHDVRDSFRRIIDERRA